MKKIVIVGLYLLCSLSTHAEQVKYSDFEISIESKPTWVVDIPLVENTISRSEDSTESVYLLVDKQIDFSKKNKAVYTQYQIALKNNSAIDENSEIKISYIPAYQNLILHDIVIHRGGKQINKVEPKKIKIIQEENELASSIYNEDAMVLIFLEDIRKGDILEYSYSIVGQNPVFPEEKTAYVNAGWTVAVKRNSIRLITDDISKLNYQYNLIKQKPKVKETNGITELVWQLNDQPAIFDEGQYPKWYSLYPYIEFSEYDDWSKVVNWAVDIYDKKEIGNKQLKSLVKKWRKESKTETEYAQKALDFVQNEIRYLGIEVGINSYVPYPVDQVFERRFGDCKDKTMLLKTLLEQVGIEATASLASLSSRKGIKKMLPSPSVFDHVILKANIDGKVFWLDGTSSLQGYKLSNLAHYDYGYVLEIDEGTSDLSRTEGERKGKTNIQERYVVESYDKPVLLEVKTELFSDDAERFRRRLESDGKFYTEKTYHNYYVRRFGKAKKQTELKITDDRDNNLLTVTESYLLEDFAKRELREVSMEVYADLIAEVLSKPKVRNRNTPYKLKYPKDIVQTIKIDFPNEINWTLDENDIEINNPSFSYKRKIIATDRDVQFVHHIATKKDHVSVEGMDNYLRDLKKANQFFNFSFSVTNRDAEKRVLNLESLKQKIKQNMK